ncbi:MAG: hypothetical protein ABIV51_05985, partial [Saprospiraceae bacterium]
TCPQIQMYQDSGYFESKQSGEKIYSQGGKFKIKKAVFDINAYQEMLVQILQLEMTTQLLKFSNSKTNFSANVQKCINQSSNIYLSKNLSKIEQTRYSSGQWSLGIKNKWLMQGPAVQFFAKDCNQKSQIDGKNYTELGSISAQIPGFQWNQFSKKMLWQLKNISLQSVGSYINDDKLVANQIKWSLANIAYQNSSKKDSLQLEKVIVNIQQVVTPLVHFATNKMQVVAMDLKTGPLRFSPGKSLYKMAFDELKYLQDKNQAEISRFQLIPKLTKKQFSDQVKRTIARAEIKLPKGIVRGVSMKDILDGRFVCASAELQQLRVDLYKDQNIPLQESDLKKMPQVLLKRINLGLNVPVINVNDAYLRFEGIGKDATKPGVLWFEHINGKVLNAGNMNPNRALELRLSTSFMGEGKMSSVMKFPMNSARNPYYAEFDVGPMPLVRFNVFFAEFASIKVDEGKLKSMHITFAGDTALTTTNMTFIYSGLKILLVQREGKKTKELLTVAANAVLMEANPSSKTGLRESEVETEFQSNLFVIGNWMRGFTAAALETMSPSMSKIFGKRLKRKK